MIVFCGSYFSMKFFMLLKARSLGTILADFFYSRFYAIMHRTTIVQNKIISSICSCLFFCPVNIYRPSLGKVRLGRPTQNRFSHSILISEEKKDYSIQNCMHYNASEPHRIHKHSNTCHAFNFNHNFFFLNARSNVLYQNQ